MHELSESTKNAILTTVNVVFFPYSYYQRRKLIDTSKKNEKRMSAYINAAESALLALSKQNPSRKGHKTEWELASASFYAATLSLDLNSAVWIAATLWRKQKKDYIWRTIALTLYEGIRQYQKYVLPSLSKFLTENEAEQELMCLHRTCAKRFSKLSNTYASYLYDIRNNCIAHREVDYQKFKTVRGTINEQKIMACLTDFLQLQAETQQIFGASFKRALEKSTKS